MPPLMRICFPVIIRRGEFVGQEYEEYQISFRDTVMWRQAMGLPVPQGMMNHEPDTVESEEEREEQEQENKTVNSAVAEQSVVNLKSHWSYSSSEDEDDDEDQESNCSESLRSPTLSELLNLYQPLSSADELIQQVQTSAHSQSLQSPTLSELLDLYQPPPSAEQSIKQVQASAHSQSDSPSAYSQESLPRNQTQPDPKPEYSQSSLPHPGVPSYSPSEYLQPSLPRHQPQPSRASYQDSLGYANEDERIQDQREQTLLILEGRCIPIPDRDYSCGPLAFIFQSMYRREQLEAKVSTLRRVMNKLLCIRPPPPPPVRTPSEIARPRGWAVLHTLITNGLREADRREFPAYEAGQAAHFFLVDHSGPRDLKIQFKRNLEVCSAERRVEALELMEERSWLDVIMVTSEEHNPSPKLWTTTREVKVLKWGEDMF